MTEQQPQGTRRRPLWLSLGIFLSSFFALQYAWGLASGSRLERWIIDDATVATSATVINLLSPQAAAQFKGTSIVAPSGSINIRNGCEGTEVLFLLVAALLAYPFSWRLRLIGLASGTAFVFVINQLRLLALFFSLRDDRALFAPLHGLIAPLVLIACTLLFFLGLRRWDERGRAKPHG